MIICIFFRSSNLQYDGLGGRSKNDLFPQPRSFMSSSQNLKSSKPLKNKPVSIINKQSKTIDKFFGSFDTPWQIFSDYLSENP